MNAPAPMTWPGAADRSNRIEIRCSALTYWPDCERRAAAKLFSNMVEGKGFELRETPTHVGAPIGTGVHAGSAHGMKFKMDTGDLPPLAESIDAAMAGLDEALDEAGEIDWIKGAARNKGQAQEQVRRMLTVVHRRLSPMVQPAAVEDHLVADIGHGFVLTGHRDLYCVEISLDRWIIVDLKTGAMVGAHMPQIGGYAILGRSHGNAIDGAKIFHVPRVSLSKTQPDPLIINIPIETAERAAETVYMRAKSGLVEFMNTGDPHVFMANPCSKMCSDRCPAWGTSFCREHLEKNDDSQ